MGIPKLSQDVAPYAEVAVLGEAPEGITAIEVRKIIIDGPSMVYHVYNALVGAQSTGVEAAGTIPTYRQINHCCEQFLDDLQYSGAIIVKIFFDGALPIQKRQTRQDRLEKTRQQLDNYRRIYPRPPPHISGQNSVKQYSTAQSHLANFRNVLWQSGMSHTSGPTLPPPPFMVASVVEFLRSSKWLGVTAIVPGEADEFCAVAAVQSHSAILSNDSDLLLYELGTSGVIVIPRSLQLIDANDRDSPYKLKAQCLRPVEVAKRLNVPSMLSFGFQRSRDIGPRSTVIAQRAREQDLDDDVSVWWDFKKEYCNFDVELLQCIPKSLQTLDPRIAEIICSFYDSKTLNVYYPIVLEDPNRDSAWSYGLRIRQLAYSILLRHWNKKSGISCYDHVTEYSRRGARIGDNEISLLSEKLFDQGVQTISDIISICCLQKSNNINTLNENSTDFQDRMTGSLSMLTTSLDLYLLAACIVITQRPQKSKEHKNLCYRLFASTTPINTANVRRHKMTWEDLHFLAALQCTLYSLRMFGQIIGYVKGDNDTASRCDEGDTKLLQLANSLPKIADLFFEATGPQCTQLCCSREYIEPLFDCVDRYNNMIRRPTSDMSDDIAAATLSDVHKAERAVKMPYMNANQKKSDLSKGSHIIKVKKVDRKMKKTQDRIQPSAQATQKVKVDRENLFAVLGQD